MQTTSSRPSILASLRALTPNRNLGYDEAIQIAEMQARKLIDLIADPTGIHEHHIDGLPRIAVHRDALEVVSGLPLDAPRALRSLQRRVHDEGTSLRALIDEARLAGARELLGDDRLYVLARRV